MADFESRLREAGEGLPGPTDTATRAAERAVAAAVRRRPARRPRRALRIAAVVAVALAAGLGGGFALGASRQGAERTIVQVRKQPLNASFAPGFLPAAGWTTYQSGRIVGSKPAYALATNLSADPRRAMRLDPFPADGIVIRGELSARGQDAANDRRFRPLTGPLTLEHANRSASAGGLWTLFVEVNGWNLEVDVRFGSAKPAAALVQEAERELARLVVPDQCPAGAQRLTQAGLGGAREAALSAAQHGVQRAGGVRLDWGDARVSGTQIGGFSDYVRSACGAGFVDRTVAVSVVHPHVERFSASLSQETFLLSRTARGWVVWAQVH